VVTEKVESQAESSDDGGVGTQSTESKEEVQHFQEEEGVQVEESEQVPEIEEHHVADDVASVAECSKSLRGQGVQNPSSEDTEVQAERSVQAGSDEEVIAKPSEENVIDGGKEGENKDQNLSETAETEDKSKRRKRRTRSSSEEQQDDAEETESVPKRTRQGRTPTKTSQKSGEKFTIVNASFICKLHSHYLILNYFWVTCLINYFPVILLPSSDPSFQLV